MLDKKIANDVIHEAIAQGATFCDLFVEKNQIEIISFNSSKVKNIESGTDFGIGVRLFFGTRALYGYTNSNRKEDLINLTRKLAAYYREAPSIELKPLHFADSVIYKDIKVVPDREVDLAHKVSKIQTLNKLVRDTSPNISQVSISTFLRRQEVEIFDSEGLHATEFRPYARLISEAIASDGNQQASGSWLPGARGGWEYIENLNLPDIANRISAQAQTMLTAKPCPAGKMQVVIDNGFGGVIFHEACGHLLETTAVEKKSSVFWDRKGDLIANEAVSAVDDGTIDNEWGSISIDDEGMPTQRTQLIKDGKLTNFMADRLGSMKTGHPRTGSARRQSYKFAPASRMRNTFIEPGKHTIDELIAAMGDGLYAKSMGGGSVNPGTGEFNFAVQEGYLVKNGKITEAVKGATLIGRGEDILKKISMVGNNFELSTGMCGSVSGSVPTTVGQAAIKVDEILVGGKA